MRFGVLGPLAVWTAGGEPVAVPEAKVRLLLGLLLAEEGRPVSVGRLVESLWGDRPPGNPLNTLQTKVSQLRRVLERAEPGARELVAHGPAGYALRATEVDAARFRALAVRARAAEPRTRAELLAEALELWRGPAFADFAGQEFAEVAAARLAEERLTVREESAAVRLELGEDAGLVPELAALVAEHPLRERLWAVRLRALYRAGRQSEALAGYAEVRRLLAEELGVDPGPELAALHTALLRQDPALAPPPDPAPLPGPTPAPPPAERPRSTLPVPLTPLVGRGRLPEELAAALRTARLVTLTGPGGVGKTRLAVDAAHRALPDHPDGVWLVELAGLLPTAPDPAADVAQLVLRTLGVRDAPDTRRAAASPGGRTAEALRDRRTLLVLDNCEHLLDPVAALLEPLLGAAPGLRVLATSREPLGLPGERVRPVPPLDPAAAVELFTARAAAVAPGAVRDGAAEAAAVAAVCRRLDGLPLALELAATRVRSLGVTELAARLDDRFAVLGEGLRGGLGRQRTLRAVIDWSWELLSAHEQVVLRRLAVHADGFGLDTARQVCTGTPGPALTPAEALAAVLRLADRSLVVVRPDAGPGGVPRYGLLESVAAYGLARLAEAGETTGARTAFVRALAALVEQAGAELYGPGQRRALAALDAEAGNLRAALSLARELGLEGEALRLAGSACWYWFLRGRFREALGLLSLLPPDGAEPPSPDRRRAAAWREAFALLCGESTGAALTHLAAGPHLPEPAADPAGHPARLPWLAALAHWTAGRLPDSETWLARALPALEAADDRWGRAAALALRGQQRLVRGELAGAAEDGRSCAALFEELGDAWGLLTAHQLLGNLAEIAGEYPRAAEAARAGRESAEELGLWPEAVDRLWAQGRVEMLRGHHTAARELLLEARRLAVRHGYRSGRMHADSALALCARRAGDAAGAEQLLRALLTEYRSIDFAPGEALALAELGFVAAGRGRPAEAWQLHTRGLAAARRTGDPRAVALALEGRAELHALAGAPVRAAELLGAAAAAREHAGAPLPAGERADVDRVEAAVRARLAPAAHTAATARGRAASARELWQVDEDPPTPPAPGPAA